jgi:hypothetical protein
MLVVFGHGEAELGDGGIAVYQQAPFEIGIRPGTRDEPGPLASTQSSSVIRTKSSIKPAAIRLRSRTPARALPRVAQSAWPPRMLSGHQAWPTLYAREPAAARVLRQGPEEITGLKPTASVVVRSNLFGSEIRNGYAGRFSQRVFQGGSMAQDAISS